MVDSGVSVVVTVVTVVPAVVNFVVVVFFVVVPVGRVVTVVSTSSKQANILRVSMSMVPEPSPSDMGTTFKTAANILSGKTALTLPG